MALFVVTAGAGIRQRSEEAKAEGRYLYSHGLQALALESAEACAEWLHRRIRDDWGFPDPPTLTMSERFTSRYRGKRYSFGYPACPNLEDQAGMWMLLRPEEIGERKRARLSSSRLHVLLRGRAGGLFIAVVRTCRYSSVKANGPQC
jgi:5-methyltetrahydrofolate--homocysteine methyltransferase